MANAEAHQFYRRPVTNSSAPPPPGRRPRRASDGVLYLAITLFGAGLLAIVAIFLTPVLSDSDPALWLYLTAMLTPVGFLLAIGYALWSGRRAR